MYLHPLGVNIMIRYVQDMTTLQERLNALRPAWCTICVDKDEHIPYLRSFALQNPGIRFLARMVDVNPDVEGTQPRDGKWHLKPADGRKYLCSPEHFLSRWGEMGRGGLVLSVSNEPNGYVDKDQPDNLRRLAEWTLEVLKLATSRGIACGVLNFATGHPMLITGKHGTEWVSLYDEVLRYVSENRQHLVALNEYLPGIGIDNRVGRVGAMINRCTTLGIKPPRVVIKEYGADNDTADKLDGYKSRGWGGGFYAEQLILPCLSTYKPHIEAGVVEGLCVFVYGGGQQWKNFDVEADAVFWQTLESSAPRVWVPGDVTNPKPVTTSPPAPLQELERGEQEVVKPVEVEPVVSAPTWRVSVTLGDKGQAEMIARLLGAMGLSAQLEAVSGG
jgi:hypothetical protein